MVEYEITLEEDKQFIKKFFLHKTVPMLWGIAILAFLGGFMVGLGYTLFPDVKNMGILLIICSVLIMFMYVMSLIVTVKSHVNSTALFCENGKRACRVELIEDKFVITNLTKSNMTTLDREDIISVKAYQGILIVKLKSKQCLLMPDKDELRELFTDYFGR